MVFYATFPSEEEGPTKLEDILTFATGSNVVPPIGFSPQPSLEFLHNEGKYPVANTCINCLRLPIHKSYEDFKNNMDFGIQNTQGFGMQQRHEAICSLVLLSQKCTVYTAGM